MGIIIDILKDILLSAVLKERLAEAEKQYTPLLSENATLKSENGNLKAQLQESQAQSNRFKDQIANLESRIARSSEDVHLEQSKQGILTLLGRREQLHRLGRGNDHTPTH